MRGKGVDYCGGGEGGGTRLREEVLRQVREGVRLHLRQRRVEGALLVELKVELQSCAATGGVGSASATYAYHLKSSLRE